ncbi:MAG: GLUG motif-containing protein [Sedimentisphaerales bacterium]
MGRTLFAAIIVGGLVLSSVCFGYSGGSGTAEDPYQIATKADLLALAATTADYGKCFILTADIDLDPNLPGNRIFTTAVIAADIDNSNSEFDGTLFTGVLDGAGHKIINLTINTNGGGNSYLGLFGDVAGGEIKNLGLENVSITGGDDSYSLGGLAGDNAGTINNCFSIGTVAGGYYCGGLTGGNNGDVDNCYSTGAVNGLSDYVGGLVGYNSNNITNCYSTGAVSGTSYVGGLVGYNEGSISNCYATGAVSDTSNVGGLVGWNDGSTVGSFWDVNTSGQTTSAGGTGKTTAEMKTKSTFTDAGWDFMTIWAICEGTNYPRLTWQIPAADWVCPDGVNMEDLSYFVQRWLESDCASSHNCDGADMNGSGAVDFADFAIFAQHWLQQD